MWHTYFSALFFVDILNNILSDRKFQLPVQNKSFSKQQIYTQQIFIIVNNTFNILMG